MSESNKFKNGDKVKILDAGDKSMWCNAMNGTVGKIGTVEYEEETRLLTVYVDNEWWYYDESNLELVSSKEDNSLTQSELQVLISVLSSKICMFEEFISDTKLSIKYCYPECNPDDSSTKDFFESLNSNKDHLRYLKSKKNKLAKIQAKLKRNLSTISEQGNTIYRVKDCPWGITK